LLTVIFINHAAFAFECDSPEKEIFETTDCLYSGRAIVMDDKTQTVGFVDEKGEVAIPLISDDGHRFSEGLASVYLKGRVGVINTLG
ncbi:WG repeat-containing protein, partial [Pseudomonas sp. HY13-MNA-CIBAN-0226]|uniref:WG repeat-containing protein n=1 Tax=Pseudomonas sp. HY13-MNA-CIBAN-0226 TaxID=3140473 RepID=UPI00331E7001